MALTDNTIYSYGTDYHSESVEQKAALHISADGILTITRRWVGATNILVDQQTDIRTQMPAWDNAGGPNSQLTSFVPANALCIETDIDPVEGKSDVFMLTETYQGYISAPFTIFSWQTSRLDLPIVQHPNFNSGSIMQGGVHWQNNLMAPANMSFPGFTVWLMDGDNNPITGTLNPYVGIENFPVETGIWKKTSFYCTTNNGTPNVPVIGNGTPISGKLWKADAPSTLDSVSGNDYGQSGNFNIGLPDTSNDNNPRGSNFVTWIKSEENLTNLFRGASELWSFEEAWWANPVVGWRKDIYQY